MLRDSHHVPAIHSAPVVHGHGLEETIALKAAREWRKAGANLLVLAGDVGTGKSLAAAWALYDYLQVTTVPNPWGKKIAPDGRLWIAAPHLARLTGWKGAEDLELLEQSKILVLDDLGEEEGTPKSLSTISTLVTTRIANGLPTIITTNLAGATFKERYGERIIDRLRQCGLDEEKKARWWVRCLGESLRGTTSPRPRPLLEHDDAPPLEPESTDLAVMGNEFLRRIGQKSNVTDGGPRGPRGSESNAE